MDQVQREVAGTEICKRVVFSRVGKRMCEDACI